MTRTRLPRRKRFSHFFRSVCPVLFVFALAFFPRALGYVGSMSIWQSRAKAFMDAIASRDWASTLQAPHPGVTTMWLAGLGRLASTPFVSDFDALSLAQQSAIELAPIALVVALAIALAYLLLARVFDRQIALVAALLLALDPYHISLSKAVHVDALVSVFSMLSALHLWVFIKERSRLHVLLSGIFAALGLLTKTPALFLVPYFFLVLLVWQASRWLEHRRHAPQTAYGSWLLLRQVGAVILLWVLAFVVTYFLVWPSMWIQPVETLAVTFGGARYYRDTPHENPTFFMGQATSQDPGPLFYPVNMAIKTTAVSFIGFLLSLPLLFRRQLEPHKRLALWLGLAFVFFFTVQMTLGEKKFARYALPALQFVIILAGVGWVAFSKWLTRSRSVLLVLSLVLVVTVQGAVSIPRHPYYGTHYSYLFGGPKHILESEIVAGQEKGEGLEMAADYLNSLPLSPRLVVGVHQFASFYPYFHGKSVPLTDDKVDYILFTRSIVVRGLDIEDWQDEWEAYRNREPKFVASFDGVPYVWVYKAGPVIEETDISHLVRATMGGSISLLGYDFEPSQVRPGETVRLVIYWEALRHDAGDYTVFNHLLDPSGSVVAQKDSQPQAGMYPTYLWGVGERVRDEYQLVVPPDASAGDYTFAVGMYVLQTMERLPIITQAGTSPYDRRLLLEGPEVLR